MFNDSDYSVFMTNSPKEKKEMEEIKALAMMALQQDKASLLDAVTVVKAASVGEITRKLQESADRDQQQQEERFQQEQETQQQAAESVLQNGREEREFQETQNQLDRENKLRVAYVQAAGFDDEKDRNDNNVPDVVEYGEEAIKNASIAANVAATNQKLMYDSVEKEKDRTLEREKMKSTERIADEKNKTAMKNPVVGERK